MQDKYKEIFGVERPSAIYERSERVTWIVSESDAERINTRHGKDFVKVGEVGSQLPPAETIEKAWERLVKCFAHYNFENLQIKLFQTFGEPTAPIIRDHLASINSFINEAETQSIKEAFEKPDFTNQKQEFLRLKHGYYKRNICDYKHSWFPVGVYGEYFLFKEWLELRLKDFNTNSQPEKNSLSGVIFKNVAEIFAFFRVNDIGKISSYVAGNGYDKLAETESKHRNNLLNETNYQLFTYDFNSYLVTELKTPVGKHKGEILEYSKYLNSETIIGFLRYQEKQIKINTEKYEAEKAKNDALLRKAILGEQVKPEFQKLNSIEEMENYFLIIASDYLRFTIFEKEGRNPNPKEATLAYAEKVIYKTAHTGHIKETVSREFETRPLHYTDVINKLYAHATDLKEKLNPDQKQRENLTKWDQISLQLMGIAKGYKELAETRNAELKKAMVPTNPKKGGLKFYIGDPKKGGKEVNQWEYLKESGTKERLEQKGLKLNPTHNFNLLKPFRLDLYNEFEEHFIKERAFNGLETGETEIKAFYLHWLNKELITIERWLSDKHPNGQPKRLHTISDQIEIGKYSDFIKSEIETVKRVKQSKPAPPHPEKKESQEPPKRFILFSSSEIIDKLFEALKINFPGSEKEFKAALEGAKLSTPLLFPHNQNKFSEVFRRAKYNNFLTSSSTEITNWLCSNFQFQYTKGEFTEVRNFNPSTVLELIKKGKGVPPPKERICKFDWLPFKSPGQLQTEAQKEQI